MSACAIMVIRNTQTPIFFLLFIILLSFIPCMIIYVYTQGMTPRISCDLKFHDRSAQATCRTKPMLYGILLMHMIQPPMGYYHPLTPSMSFHLVLLLLDKPSILFLFSSVQFYFTQFSSTQFHLLLSMLVTSWSLRYINCCMITREP